MAIFDNTSVLPATIDVNANVRGMTIGSGYTGTITQNPGMTVTVGSDGYTQSGGTFTGSSAGDAITDNGFFVLNAGGVFRSTNGIFDIVGSSTFLGTFQNNSGVVQLGMTSNKTLVTGSAAFYDLWLGDGSLKNFNITIASGTVLTVTASTTFAPNSTVINLLGSGEIDAQGDIFLNNPEAGTTPTGKFNFVINGAGSQAINDQGFSSALYPWYFPSITVSKPSGVLNLGSGFLSLSGDWKNTSGPAAVNPASSTVVIQGVPSAAIAGSTAFNDLWLGLGGNIGLINHSITVATGTVVTVQASTTFGVNGSILYLLGSGEIDAKGDLFLFGQENGLTPTSTFNFVMNGAGTQSFNDQGNSNVNFPWYFPSLTINKPSGVVNLGGSTVSIIGNFTNNNGTAGVNAGTSTVMFGGKNLTVTGSTMLYSVWLGDSDTTSPWNHIITIPAGTVITANGSTTFGAETTMIYLLGGGEFDAKGDIRMYLGEIGATPTSTFNFVVNGTGTQIIDDNSNSSAILPWYLPNLTILKPSGVVFVSSTQIEAQQVMVTQGELRLSSSSQTAQTFQADGAVTIAANGILSGYPWASSTLVLGSSLTNNGLVFFDGSAAACTVPLPNYLSIVSATSGVRQSWFGTGNTFLRYVAVQDQGGTLPVSVWNGTNNGNNGANWTFVSGPVPQLIQSAKSSGGAGTTQVALPAFGFQPRQGDLVLVAVSARNQTIAAPVDTASNTYQLVTSSTFGSSPSYAVSLYYAKNIAPSSTFAVTAKGNGGTNPFLSAAAFEYTGMSASSTFDTSSVNTDGSGGATSLTSFTAAGRWPNELYFGTLSFSASTTPSSAPGWTAEPGITNNNTTQALYIEDIASSTPLTTAATWTSPSSTSYGAILGLFRAPFSSSYAPNGTLDSTTFDTGVPGGVQLNSLLWQGTMPSNSSVKLQLAVSNSPTGPWNFQGPDGTGGTYFSGNPGVPISLLSTFNGYLPFNGYRYYRYRVTLFADSSQAFTPTVTQVVVNWSP